MDIVVWLRSLGLGKYEAAFRENEIDEAVLPNLTAEDLKELGVASLGHAIAALRSDRAAKRHPLTQRPIERPKRTTRRPRRACLSTSLLRPQRGVAYG